jgi:hypothetical protein
VRAFPVRLPSGQRYWTVLDADLRVVEVADGFLRHQRLLRVVPREHVGVIAGEQAWCVRSPAGLRAGRGFVIRLSS